MTRWLPGADSAVATMHGLFGSGFGGFLSMIGVEALLLAFVIAGIVIFAARIGDAQAARQNLRVARSFVPAVAAYTSALPAAAAILATPARKAGLTILYATETGNAEALAGAAGEAAARLRVMSRVVDMADTTPSEVATTQNLMVIASTWGEGEPPQRAADFYDALMGADAPRFDGVRFAVLALGDRAYARLDHFCETGRCLDARLGQLGGSRMADRGDCDADYEAQADAWIGATLKKLAPLQEPKAPGTAGTPFSVIPVEVAYPADATGSGSRAHQFESEIMANVNLSGSGSSPRTFHVALALAGSGILHEPGDSLGILPHNDAALIEEMLNIVGLGGEAALREAMGARYDITALTLPQLVSYAELSQDKALGELAADPERAGAFLNEGRQLIDLLAASPRRLTVEQFTGLLRRLQPRLYSIASSRKKVPDEADLLIAAVEYEVQGRMRKGVASMDMTERHHVGDRLRVYLKPNPHFRLPADPAQRVIMVGPGTGVAPFRAFMQERDATGATGKNWLFFGHRRHADDFLYQLEWKDLQKRGVLNRLDVAFSRDQQEKIYVQDRMWDARRDLFAWLQDGAALYVCGDASAMARDVNSTLLRIAADQGEVDAQAWLARLRRSGRYLRDVY